jgi:hypothetical protein
MLFAAIIKDFKNEGGFLHAGRDGASFPSIFASASTPN